MDVVASPSRVWALVSDVTNTRRFSPETFDAQWLGGASGPARGAKFRGHVERNGKPWLIYWTTCVVTECDVDREFGFQVLGLRGRPMVSWNYRLEPTAEGTRVTESFSLADTPWLRLYGALAGRSRTRTNLANMRTTLQRIKVVAEADDGQSPDPGPS
jgi:hypothetical protein